MKANIELYMESVWGSIFNIPLVDVTNATTPVEPFPILKYMEMNNITVFKYNPASGTLSYVSDNVHSILGISNEVMIQNGIFHLMTFLKPEHIKYPQNIFDLVQKALTEWEPVERSMSIECIIVGMPLIHTQKGDISVLNLPNVIARDEKNMPVEMLSLMQDITHLMKDNHYWIRVWNSHNPEKVLVFHSNEDLNISGDILSKREKVLLRLIVEGKNTDEISKELFISRITVNNHRQKILDKFGVKDTTALIILSRLINFSSWV